MDLYGRIVDAQKIYEMMDVSLVIDALASDNSKLVTPFKNVGYIVHYGCRLESR